MKKIGIFVVLIAIILIASKILLGVPDYPEKVLDIVKHWCLAWIKGGVIAVVVISIIFMINKKLKSEHMMSTVGMVIMPVVIPALIYICFGYILWLTILGVAAGLIIGYFSYIIDDHLLEAWKMRHIVLPLLFGLGFGTSSVIAAISENWQDEYVYVHDHATCHQLNLQRYTSHTSTNGKTTTTRYSWDTYKTLYFFNRGEEFVQPQENKDYTLGSGAFGRDDRVRHDYHKWIGGEKMTKFGENLGFKWIYLHDINLKYESNAVSEVEENFFGHAIHDGKKKDIAIPAKSETKALPTSRNVPGMISMSLDFFKIMATNPDLSLLRWIYLLIYLPFCLGAVFSPELRISLFIFFISSTIIILIIIGIIAGRSGRSLEDFVPRFGGFRGGSFGGGGANSRW